MPQKAWSNKRERQYEHIKDEREEARRVRRQAPKEIAARTVNKERARAGEAKTSSRTSREDMSSGRRGGLRSHDGPRGRTKEQLYNEAKQHEHPGPLEDEQGAARARRRPAQVATHDSERRGGDAPPLIYALPHESRDTRPRRALGRRPRPDRGVPDGGAGMHIVERTDAFTLVGSDARRGKLTLFAEEGPRERGPLKHVALRVSDLEQLWPTCRRTPTSNGRATARPTSTSTRD